MNFNFFRTVNKEIFTKLNSKKYKNSINFINEFH